MKILLVVPRYSLTNKADYNYMFPLGLGYISTVLKKAGHDVHCLNLNHHNGSIEEIMYSSLNKDNYGVVCTGHMAIGYQVIKKIVDSARSNKHKPKIIIGGAIVTSEPDLIFNSLNPDYAVLGEGEVTIVELLRSLEKGEDLSKVNGIMFKKEGNIVTTPARETIQDLDSLPFPDFDGFGFREQLENTVCNEFIPNNLLDFPRPYPILCSRSCPYSCTFCYHTLGRQYRKRSIDNVMQELELAIKNYGINNLLIYDDLFSADKDRLYEFCIRIKKLFKQYGTSGYWTCQLIVNNIDRKMLDTLKDAGCCTVCFGFESMSLIVLKSMKKPITPEQIDNAIRLCNEEGINIYANFIFGDIAETKETACETLNYWKEKCRGQIGLSFIQPYPGSAIYDHCVKKGIIKDKLEFIKGIGVQDFFNMTEKMSDREVDRLKYDILSALVKYQRSTTPVYHKEIKENVYEVRVICPYCKESVTYRNFFIKNKNYFESFMTCRSCKMRFFVYSPIKKLLRPLYPFLQPIKTYYNKMRNRVLKKAL